MWKLIWSLPLVLLLGISSVSAQVDYTPLPDAGATGHWEGPLLVCWQPERLIAALQPGVQGIPEYCGILDPPVTFQVNDRVWETTLMYQGKPLLVGVYEINVVGRSGTMYTVLTAPAE